MRILITADLHYDVSRSRKSVRKIAEQIYCGHSHWPDRSKVAHMDVVNVGSTYVEKQLKIFEAPGGLT